MKVGFFLNYILRSYSSLYRKMLLLHNSRVIELLKGADSISIHFIYILYFQGGLRGPYHNYKISL